MSNETFAQEQTDEGLHFAHLLLLLIKAPALVSRKQWSYLDNFHIGMLQREAGYSHTEAIHVANQIDRAQSLLSRWGRLEFLTDAMMMWLVGGGFLMAGILLAIMQIPDSILGRLVVPCSVSIAAFFIAMPFVGRKRARDYNRQCFEQTIIDILGVGLLKRAVVYNKEIITQLNPSDTKRTVTRVVSRFLESKGDTVPQHEELTLLKQLLDEFGMKLKDLPYPIMEKVAEA